MSHGWIHTYYSDLSPYNMREQMCIISRTIRASGPWAHGKNILDMTDGPGGILFPMQAGGPMQGICKVDEWADVHAYSVDGWVEVVGYYVDGCIKVDCVSDRLICEGYLLSHLQVGPDAYLIRRVGQGDYKILN
jgi:hypothetical protein